MIEKFTNRSRQQLSSLFSSINFFRVHLDWVLKEGTGNIWVDNIGSPKVALLVTGIVTVAMSYVAGDYTSEVVPELLKKIPAPSGIIYPNEDWKKALIQKFHPKLQFMTRTDLSSDSLDIERIKSLKTVPAGFTLQKISKEIQQ